MSEQTMRAALERLCKWRIVLAGWHLGTRAKSEPGAQAMRDLRELTTIMRVELSALSYCLIQNGSINAVEFQNAIEAEAKHMEGVLEKRFPGMRASDTGIVLHDLSLANETMKRLGFLL